MNQLVSAIADLGQRFPSFPSRVLAYRESVPTGLCGSYVSLTGDRTEHIVGLLAQPLAWEALSRALDHDSPLPESRGLVEASCEVGKLVTEAFRARLGDAQAAVVGLPLFTEGLVSGGRRLELQAADISLGGNLVLLVLFSRPELRPKPRPSEHPLSRGVV
jgi:hypothetical protein